MYDVLVDALKSLDEEDFDRSAAECKLKDSLTKLLTIDTENLKAIAGEALDT